MKLNTLERLLLLNILPPAEGDFTMIKLMRMFREDLSFDEDERKLLNFHKREEDGKLQWHDVAPEKEIIIGDSILTLIRDTLLQLNASKKLHEDHYSLYMKFVGEYGAEGGADLL